MSDYQARYTESNEFSVGGTVSGAGIGATIGLAGGPLGAAVGAGIGAAVGFAFDLVGAIFGAGEAEKARRHAQRIAAHRRHIGEVTAQGLERDAHKTLEQYGERALDLRRQTGWTLDDITRGERRGLDSLGIRRHRILEDVSVGGAQALFDIRRGSERQLDDIGRQTTINRSRAAIGYAGSGATLGGSAMLRLQQIESEGQLVSDRVTGDAAEASSRVRGQVERTLGRSEHDYQRGRSELITDASRGRERVTTIGNLNIERTLERGNDIYDSIMHPTYGRAALTRLASSIPDAPMPSGASTFLQNLPGLASSGANAYEKGREAGWWDLG